MSPVQYVFEVEEANGLYRARKTLQNIFDGVCVISTYSWLSILLIDLYPPQCPREAERPPAAIRAAGTALRVRGAVKGARGAAVASACSRAKATG